MLAAPSLDGAGRRGWGALEARERPRPAARGSRCGPRWL